MNKSSIIKISLLILVFLTPGYIHAVLPEDNVAHPPLVGGWAPEFSAIDSDGNTIKLSDFTDKIVILEWVSSACPYTGRHYKEGTMQALQKKALEQGLVWLSISSTAHDMPGYFTAEDANNWITHKKAAPTAFILDEDGKIGKLYNAITTPQIFIINSDGKLAYAGAVDSNPSAMPSPRKVKNYVKAALNSLLANQKIAVPVTRSYGCTIKYANPS